MIMFVRRVTLENKKGFGRFQNPQEFIFIEFVL